MDQTSIDEPGNDLQADALVRAIESFLLKTADRADDEHAKHVKNGGELDGKKIGQKPERFLEEHLVKRCVEILGYTVYRPQPKGIAGLDDKIPDFLLGDAEYLTIGEIKKPNSIQDARKECREYLSEIEKPAAGIATDGFTWKLYLSNGDASLEEKNPVRLQPSVNRLGLEHLHKRGTRRDRRPLREEVHGLVDNFRKRAVESQMDAHPNL